MKIRINIDLQVGRVVKYFVLTDLVFLAGWGILEPVFSIFVLQQVAGATIITVGVASAIYWLLRSLLQLPVANFLDRTPGEQDDFQILIGGLLLAALSAFSFILVHSAWQLYAVQVLHAIAFSLYVPAWSGIFSRHLDKDRVAFDWTLDNTAVGLAIGASSLAGGLIAGFFGFAALFIITAACSLAAAVLLLATPSLVLPRPQRPVLIDKTPGHVGK